MRRIYESNALRRETGPFTPHERRDDDKGPSPPDPDDTGILDKIVPGAVRRRAITIDVTTPKDAYELDSPIPFRVELHNQMPFDVSIKTPTPVLWTWSVNGLEQASYVELDNPPADEKRHAFSSGERKRFVKRWPQRFRRTESEWERAGAGTYTIQVSVNLPGASLEGLTSETRVEIRPDSRSGDADD